MVEHEVKLEVYSVEDFRKWLDKNHDKVDKVSLIIHKKHTGKGSPSHRELMWEAICHGWIDTTIKRIDEDKFIRNFSRRNKNSSWSVNTLSYGKQLIKEGRMKPHGLVFYNEGKKKKAFDHGIPKNPEMTEELRTALDKNRKAKTTFDALSPSAKRTYLRWLAYAKTEPTRKKRISLIIEKLGQGKKNPWGP